MTLKDIRKNKGILAQKIAEYLGISYRQFHRIESGNAKLDDTKAESLSQIYKVDVVEIKEAWKEGSEKCAKIN